MILYEKINDNKKCILCNNKLSFLFSDKRKMHHLTQDAVGIKFELLKKFNNSLSYTYSYDYNFTKENKFYINFYKDNELLHDKVPMFLIKKIINHKKNVINLYETCANCKKYYSCYHINLNWKLLKIDSIDLQFETLEINNKTIYKIFNSYKENYTYVTTSDTDQSSKFPLLPINKDFKSYLNKINNYLLLK